MKQVIQGLEEGLGAIAEALSGGSGSYPEPTSATDGQVLTADGQGGASWEDAQGGSDIVPTPTQSDQGKALRADYYNGVGSAYWSDANLVPNASGGTAGQVLTTDGETYGWANPSGGGLPEITSDDNGKVLTAVYDDKSGSGYAEWKTPTGGSSVGHYNINIADLSYNDKSGTYSGSISIPIGKNIIGCNAVVVSSSTRMQCPVSKFTIESDGSTTWETIVISSSVYNEISTDYVYIDIIYA